jgi:glycosyltransferase involved in cell wall biosynthesis
MAGMTCHTVFHFVAGSFTGATQVAIQLALAAAQQKEQIQPVLVLCNKPADQYPERIQALREQGLIVETVPARSRLSTVIALFRLCRRYRPSALLAHGFPEHIYGRQAALLAGVPQLIHVEHNSRERYTPWRRLQTRWLARWTAASVSVSDGVRNSLLALGLPPERVLTIPNGIDLARFAAADTHPFAHRQAGIVMAARLVAQKDHTTLLHAVALLRQRGLTPPVLLAGAGGPEQIHKLQNLSQQLGISEQVQLLGHCGDLPALLMRYQIGVLSSHYEGMPLALLEAMAAGMAVVGSAVPGISELLRDGEDGCLVAHANPSALANTLHKLLTDVQHATCLAQAARRRAQAEYAQQLTSERYDALLARVLSQLG